VVHPRTLIARLFTRLPTIARLLIMNMINSMRGGWKSPCTMQDQTNTFIGLSPIKFIPTAFGSFYDLTEPVKVKPWLKANRIGSPAARA
jgi:hypothetical protein